jgi:glucose-6-phosphate dehydrogenase assembly protein OpcA
MSEDVWSERDTTPDKIEAALRELLRERHAANRALAPARVLNLVVIVDREWKGEIANRLERVGRYHASRTILCAVEEGRETLDAVAVMSYDEAGAGGVGVMHEKVEIEVGSAQLPRLDTVVDPVLVPELPTMLWSPHGHRDAVQALLRMTDVILLDSDDEDDAGDALCRCGQLQSDAYVVDLAWLRTVPWRERLAAAFDPPERLSKLARLRGVTVRHHPGSGASAALLVGWLSSRLGWSLAPLRSMNGHGAAGTATSQRGDVEIELRPLEQEAPGLAGVTVSWDPECSLSLDRDLGGLRARECGGQGGERSWIVLGASRGEGGILGEGVRQALLRDPTYSPALEAAQLMLSESAT